MVTYCLLFVRFVDGAESAPGTQCNPTSVRRPPTRTTVSPGTDDPFGLPLIERLEAAGLVLGDVEGDDDVVRQRPLLAGCLGVVCSAETRESDWSYGRGAGSGLGIGCFAQV